ncbi:dihydrolipoyllysine-residue acetyltransferase [Neptunicella marina]|uniref:Dihydrolipoamide acetyltransferase component of pyruvate dehydrogenase complex n=1 Tax=Neptunicella marina TaxID=2125989 RepID=A0A8J6M0Z7_9ALTE|nr:dihydrolipoyllysine-residue acetyltransferase [Neptunicella marina]MBC3767484.1 dihydrolipoyllysine-residue acetyltransferase [Neptunicella marina]
MKDFILPDIGEGIVECELVEWLVEEGQQIEEDQPVAEVMTDKALVQIPAMHSGIVAKLYYAKGDIAKVHEPLFAMQSDNNVVSANNDKAPAAQQESVVESASTTNSASGEQIDFILPDIGEGIVECELVEWLIEEGQMVKEDQAVAEVMTDKALVQIPAKHDGVVTKLYYAKGDIAKVHTPLFAQQVGDGAVSQPQSTTKAQATPEQTKTDDSAPVKASGKALASPAVRRLAREQGIDIAKVNGSGKKGRVMKEDVAAYVNGAQSLTSEVNSQPKAEYQAHNSQPANVTGGKRVEPIRGVKAAMAKQMVDSVSTIPHFTVSDEVDMGKLIEARALLKEQFDKEGIKLSFMPFMIKAMSLALEQFPVINAQVNDDCTELTYFDDHNIGMAVDSKIGLLVPNIKGVQNLSLKEVAIEVNRLIDQARAGRLASADLKGGTISISNVGVIGGTVATPVINKPEAAIVALGKMQKLPRFDANGQVFAANIMHISWSGDHRIIDGATMVRFSNLWRSYLENPLTMLAALK